jgi:transcriptional regulator with XRE-family HTH domain
MENNLKNWYAMSDPAVLEIIGDFIRKTRLNQNKTQQEVSENAGINRSTLVNMEKGKGGTLISLVQVLRALEQLHLLKNFEVKTELSPLQLAKIEMKKRRRASRKTSGENETKNTW